MLLFKEAEQTEKEAGVPWLRFLIYVNMSYVNFSLEANETALDYAHKALQHAINNDNVSWECFAYNSMAMSFYGMGKKDSAFKYINKIEPHLKEITDKEGLTLLQLACEQNSSYIIDFLIDDQNLDKKRKS